MVNTIVEVVTALRGSERQSPPGRCRKKKPGSSGFFLLYCYFLFADYFFFIAIFLGTGSSLNGTTTLSTPSFMSPSILSTSATLGSCMRR